MNAKKICIIQSKPARGDIKANIKGHLDLIQKAIQADADLIVFPELSITGYEPSMCDRLAMKIDDPRLTCFEEISNSKNVMIIVGAPLRTTDGVTISAIIFRPNLSKLVYTKQHLHQDELPYFVTSPKQNEFIGEEPKIALAICYELSIPSHSQRAKDKNKNGELLDQLNDMSEGFLIYDFVNDKISYKWESEAFQS